MKHLSPQQFKMALKNGDHIEGATIRKLAIATPEMIDRNRTVKFTISTETVDRDNDRINQKGWQLKNFKKNPVVLWSHQGSEPPIGRVVEIGLEDGALKATVEFVDFDNPLVGAKAEGIYRMCKDGFINATSVGFSPIEWDLSEDEARTGKNWGVDFHKQELYELSVVSIPANPEALIEPPVSDAPKSVDAEEIKLNNPRERRARLLAYLDIIGA
jgi:HK97 family phage prohead protease